MPVTVPKWIISFPLPNDNRDKLTHTHFRGEETEADEKESGLAQVTQLGSSQDAKPSLP